MHVCLRRRSLQVSWEYVFRFWFHSLFKPQFAQNAVVIHNKVKENQIRSLNFKFKKNFLKRNPAKQLFSGNNLSQVTDTHIYIHASPKRLSQSMFCSPNKPIRRYDSLRSRNFPFYINVVLAITQFSVIKLRYKALFKEEIQLSYIAECGVYFCF